MTTLQSMTRFLILALAFGLGIFGVTQNVSAQNATDNPIAEKEDNDDDENITADERKSVKISTDEARAIALKRIPGTVVEGELEKENGRLQYAFDIKDSSGRVFDVEIDAMTGEVLQASEEDDEDDDKPAKT